MKNCTLEFIIRVYLTIQSKKFTFSSYLRSKMFVYFFHLSVTLACGVFLASNMKKRWICCSVWWGSFKKWSLVVFNRTICKTMQLSVIYHYIILVTTMVGVDTTVILQTAIRLPFCKLLPFQCDTNKKWLFNIDV